MTDSFAKAMRLMRKHDPHLQEDGFGTLRAMGAKALPELVIAYETEPDHGIRCWLLELIGQARSEEALPLLTRELGSQDESLRDWARRGLELLDSRAARSVLWQDQQPR